MTKDAPSIIAPGTSVMGSGERRSATPAFPSVFETELGLTTILTLVLVLSSARTETTSFLCFSTRPTDSVLDRSAFSLTSGAHGFLLLNRCGSNALGQKHKKPKTRTSLNRLTTAEVLDSGVTKLTSAQVKEALKSLPGWKRDGDYITKDFKFRRFMDGIKFVEAVAKVADEQEHHPDIHVVWTTVTLKVTTHDEGGLTKWDVSLAKEIGKRFPGM